LSKDTKQTAIREYFESGDSPWESRYSKGDMEARMYHDRQDASLTLIRKYVPRGANVLEVGCGSGILSKKLQDEGYDVTCCDFALRMLRETRELTQNNSILVADAGALPFQDGVFDAVVLIGVMAYVAEPLAVLHGLRRLLTPSGVLLVSSANKRMLFGAISRKLNAPLYFLGARKPEADPTRKFFAETNIYYKASEFNPLVLSAGYELLGTSNIGFGRLRILKQKIFPDRFNIALSNFVSALSRVWPFRWLGDFAFNNIACFRRSECRGSPAPRSHITSN